jgi:glycosyltransferase involved in cell wall biosynthesis
MSEVSVLMPVYNGEDFVAEAVESVLKQTHRDLELVIYDDGSSDGTRDILAPFEQDPRVRLIAGEVNRGEAYARNRLLDACRTPFACWQDSDDLSHTRRLEYQLAQAAPGRMIFTQWVRFNSGVELDLNGRPVMGNMPERATPTNLFPVANALPFNETLPLELRIGEDWDWVNRMESTHEIRLLEECLYFYRNHDRRLSVLKKRILSEIPAAEIRNADFRALVGRLRGQDAREVRLDLPAEDRVLEFWLDEFKDGKKNIVVKGWVHRRGEDARGQRVFVVLSSAAGHAPRAFATVPAKRPDVTAHFRSGDLDDSGFSASVDKRSLAAGVYQLGLAVAKDGTLVWQTTGKPILAG